MTQEFLFVPKLLFYFIFFFRSALQTLHKVSSKAREHNYFLGGLTHDWVSYYEQRIESDRSCLNEWHAMDNLESRRPPSPDSVRTK
jgi:protein phosphatase slingshot